MLWIGMCAWVHLKIEESKSIDEDYISSETTIFSLSRSHLKNKNKEKNKNKSVKKIYYKIGHKKKKSYDGHNA